LGLALSFFTHRAAQTPFDNYSPECLDTQLHPIFHPVLSPLPVTFCPSTLKYVLPLPVCYQLDCKNDSRPNTPFFLCTLPFFPIHLFCGSEQPPCASMVLSIVPDLIPVFCVTFQGFPDKLFALVVTTSATTWPVFFFPFAPPFWLYSSFLPYRSRD